MDANTINKVTGILQQASVLEPAAIQLVKNLIGSTQGQSAADIAAMVHQEAQNIESIADEEIRKAGGTP